MVARPLDLRLIIVTVLTVALVLHLRMMGYAGPEPVHHPEAAAVASSVTTMDGETGAAPVHAHSTDAMLLTCIALAAAGFALTLALRGRRPRSGQQESTAALLVALPPAPPEGRDPPRPPLTPVAAQAVCLI